eukprot:TRINITY_DN1934_c3_g1_i2.p1 TRINITY_DN1934_c3_g1~~TRINITY_DN1934_c3_g1_i2.p1  ORF type:complete len:307 (-),score=81.64 TRINITY_DN1934_c3_g1_i2:233-1153(-)
MWTKFTGYLLVLCILLGYAQSTRIQSESTYTGLDDVLVETDGFLEADISQQLDELERSTSLTKQQKEQRVSLLEKKVTVLEQRQRIDILERKIAHLEAAFRVGPATYEYHTTQPVQAATTGGTVSPAGVVSSSGDRITSEGGGQSTQASLPPPSGSSAAGCPLMTYNKGWGSIFLNKKPRIDKGFERAMDIMHDAAKELGLKIHVTSHYRSPGHVVKGAVYPPASKSNHKVGHALDVNFVTPSGFCNSACIRGQRNSAVRSFVQKIKAAGLRWGGDFNDPVHFDDGLNIRNRAGYDALYVKIGNEC